MTDKKNEDVTPNGETRTTGQTTPTNQQPPLTEGTPPEKNEDTEQTVEPKITEEIVEFTQSEWNNKKAKLQQQFPELTEEDLKFEEGKHAELYERVQAKLDKTNFEVKSIIENLK